MPVKKSVRKRPTKKETATNVPYEGWGEGGFMILIVILGYLILEHIPGSLNFRSDAAFGLTAAFLIGLTAAFSTCMALVGGLLLSVSAKWHELYNPKNHWQKFQPLLHFNVGRLLGYFIFGGLIGLIGQSLTPSIRMNGILIIVIAVVMIYLGFNILRIVPKKYCTIPLPKSLMKRIHGMAESKNPFMPGLIGALTFFVPCGFTQSMQLVALGTGSFMGGGLVMFAFAVGTLPSLLGISAASSFLEGTYGRYFFKLSGAIALFLGILNLQYGFVLTGIDLKAEFAKALHAYHMTIGQTNAVTIDSQGRQIVTLTVTDEGYSPSEVTIEPGITTWIYALAPRGIFSCANVMTVPDYDVSKPIEVGPNWLGPFENPQKDFLVACSIGTLKANIRVRGSNS